MKTKQRGSGWSIRLVFNLYKLFGYKFITYLMYPVTFFYCISANNVKEALKIYYKHLNVDFTHKLYCQHLRNFAITMIDRFITKINPTEYKFIYEDLTKLLELSSKAHILVFSHFGGWSSASNFSRSSNKINIVMQELLLSSIKDIENTLKNSAMVNIIDLNQGSIAASVAIANALLQNELVAIMGDRTSSESSRKKINFLGEDAYFNENPFKIAYQMDKPLILYFVILVDIQTYKIEFIEIDIDRKKDKMSAISEAMQKYVTAYEDVVKRYPTQWFNFYDFWEKES